MEHWCEVESLAVTNIIDNDTDFLSTAACNKDGSVTYQSEVAQHVARGDMTLNFPDFCSAAHGLSLLLTAEVTTTAGREKRSLLLDAGPCPRLWEANAKKLQLDLASVECIVLSHYHADHSGGLTGAVPLIASARKDAGMGPVRLDLHQDRPESRAVQLPSGTTLPLQPETPTFEDFRQLGAHLVLSSEPHVVSDCFFVSGEIPRRTSYEKGLVGSKRLEDNDWRDDNDIDEERYVAVKVKGAGVVVFSSCSHAGIVNVCRHARDLSGVPLLAAMGGFHLGGVGLEERVSDTINDLLELRPKAILPGHCTGWRAKTAIAQDYFRDASGSRLQWAKAARPQRLACGVFSALYCPSGQSSSKAGKAKRVAGRSFMIKPWGCSRLRPKPGELRLIVLPWSFEVVQSFRVGPHTRTNSSGRTEPPLGPGMVVRDVDCSRMMDIDIGVWVSGWKVQGVNPSIIRGFLPLELRKTRNPKPSG
ncbi:unnamed protein product [Symbiodinium microadriaticum]|nr:unnamed protein product [Symbiodinium microadriaticum]